MHGGVTATKRSIIWIFSTRGENLADSERWVWPIELKPRECNSSEVLVFRSRQMEDDISEPKAVTPFLSTFMFDKKLIPGWESSAAGPSSEEHNHMPPTVRLHMEYVANGRSSYAPHRTSATAAWGCCANSLHTCSDGNWTTCWSGEGTLWNACKVCRAWLD